MSFWENNKGTFKAAGVATVKGIGHGTKAISKAGYRTYKNSESRKKGIEPTEQEKDTQLQLYPSAPVRYDNLNTLPAPPQRVAPIHDIHEHQTGTSIPVYSSQQAAPGQPVYQQQQQQPQGYQQQPQGYQQQQQPQGYQQPAQAQPVYQQQQPQGYQQQPAHAQPAYQQQQQPPQTPPTYQQQQQQQPPQAPPTYQQQQQQPPQPPQPPQPQPAYQQQQQQQQQSPQVQPAYQQQPQGYQVQVPPLQGIQDQYQGTPQVTETPIYSATTPNVGSGPQIIPQNEYSSIPAQPIVELEAISPKPMRPLPDPSSFPAPPIRRDRGQSAESVKSQTTNLRQSPSHIPPLPSRNNTLQLNPSSFQPPPPIRRTNDVLNHTVSPDHEYQYSNPRPDSNPVSVSKTSPDSSTVNLNEVSAPPMPLRPSSTSSSSSAVKKKAPPPKPAKKPQNLTSLGTSLPPHMETANAPAVSKRSTSSSASIPQMPNFAEEISKRVQKLNTQEEPEMNETQVIPGSYGEESKSTLKPQPPVTKQKPQLKPKPHVAPKPVLLRLESSQSLFGNSPGSSHSVLSSSLRPKSASSTPPPPPPSRNYNRPKAAAPPVLTQSPTIDLELTTGWYDVNHFKLPTSLSGLNYLTSYRYSSSGPVVSHTRTLTVRLKDLSTLRIVINWRNSDFMNADGKIEKHTPSPIVTSQPSRGELMSYHERFGEYVASWCEHRFGQQVGRGECWDLGHDALQKGCGNHAFVSEYNIHGYPILQVQGTEQGASPVNDTQPSDEVRRGDILQYTSCVFKDKSTGSVQTAGDPDHTSVVLQNTGHLFIVAEQNVKNVKLVQQGEVNIKNLAKGTLIAYRPVPNDWVNSLT
ncbi:uncharacterized protein PRCAT00002731001 [Priceomyces carsonii]|uniref:uncharacterized protein n=1 Tax=Priceomyces carsonii TaxID=28549 RepID=UPI002ED83B8C|nr:unnamed protein product [Priceomyces carsonii]